MEKRFTTIETMVAMSASEASGIGLGMYFVGKLNGKEWLVPGMVLGMAFGFCSTFFLVPMYIARYLDKQRRIEDAKAKEVEAKHRAKKNHPSNFKANQLKRFPFPNQRKGNNE